MWSELKAGASEALGLHVPAAQLGCAQMALRALVVFCAALVILRVAHKRTFAQRNTLDVLLGLVVASTLSRAINGSAAFFPTLLTGFVLVGLHYVLAWCTARFPFVENLVKGRPASLVRNGRVDLATLRRHSLSADDLREDLRIAGVEDPDGVRSATLERSGQISVVRAATNPGE